MNVSFDIVEVYSAGTYGFDQIFPGDPEGRQMSGWRSLDTIVVSIRTGTCGLQAIHQRDPILPSHSTCALSERYIAS